MTLFGRKGMTGRIQPERPWPPPPPGDYPTRQVLPGLLAEHVSRDERANEVANGPPDAARMGELTERAREALGRGGKPLRGGDAQ